MSDHGSSEKGVNTSLICQENCTCGGTEEAAFECDECRSLQCVCCKQEIHSQERLQNHEQVKMGPGHVPYCDNCKGRKEGTVNGPGHRSVVRCQNCKLNLCQQCRKRTHNGGNKKRHQLTAYPLPPKPAEIKSTPPPKPAEINLSPVVDEAEVQKAKLLEKVCSFLLVDSNEEMQIKDEGAFVKKLNCKPDKLIKVVSIFGNTGKGKCYTLNHTFFMGREVFKTSPTQESCTVGGVGGI